MQTHAHPGRLIVFTGEGKGKTTAALGMALRACGHGKRILILQFIKSETTGEANALRCLPEVELQILGKGFVPPPDHPDFAAHREAAHAALRRARAALRSGQHPFVILDEICGAIAHGLLAEQEVLAALDERAPGLCVVLTGRGATPGLIARADTATEMRCIKHAFTEDIRAQPGVEF